jgi:hypothetical protein
MLRSISILSVVLIGQLFFGETQTAAQTSWTVARTGEATANERLNRTFRPQSRMAQKTNYCGQCTSDDGCGVGFKCCSMKGCNPPAKGCFKVATCASGGN